MTQHSKILLTKEEEDINMKDEEISKIFKKEEKPINRTDEFELLNQFYVTVEATYQRINNSIEKKTEETPVETEISKLLKAPKTWGNIYKIEHLLVDLYDETFIVFEIKRRMLEIDRNLYKEQIDFYNTEVKNLNTIIEKRNFLSRLINDLQWRYTIRETKHEFQRKARRRSSTVLFGAIIFFMIILFMKLFGFYVISYINIDIAKIKQFYILLEVAAAGLFGSSLSIATSINKSIELLSFDNLKITHRMNYIVSRVSIGIGAAMIMYYFIQSGILTAETNTTSTDLEYKLIILGFIAGFSEKLIPSVINKTSKNLATETDDTEKKPEK